MKTTTYFRNTFLVLSFAALLLAGCSKDQQKDIIPETSLQMDFPAIPFTIDSNDVAGGQVELNLNIDPDVLGQVLTANNYSITQLTEFKFTKAHLFLSSPYYGNYDALHSITLQVAVDQSPPVTVAGLDPVPDNAQTLIMHLSDVNVLDLLKSSNVHFIAKMQLDGPLLATSSHTLVLSAKVGVGL